MLCRLVPYRITLYRLPRAVPHSRVVLSALHHEAQRCTAERRTTSRRAACKWPFLVVNSVVACLMSEIGRPATSLDDCCARTSIIIAGVGEGTMADIKTSARMNEGFDLEGRRLKTIVYCDGQWARVCVCV